jgi:zinc protease
MQDFRNRCAALLFGMLASPGLIAQPGKPPSNVLPLDTAVHTGKLLNGFTYYIRHNAEPQHQVVMYLVNKVGSIQETDDQLGLAHFVEHMSFNGTKHFPKNELVDYLQKSGVRFGADLNAMTTFDHTIYQLPLPAGNPAVVQNGLQIMRDWAQDATLDGKEIDKERGVILEEKRLRVGASQRMQDQYLPMIWNHSRYANRLPIGTDAVLNHFAYATLRQYYHDWYRPNLQAIIIVGDIDVKEMEKKVKALFGDLKNPANEKPYTKYTIPLSGKNQFMAITDKEETNTSFQVLMKHTAPGDMRTAADYRASIVRSLLTQLLATRFIELNQKLDPDFQSGTASVADMVGGTDYFGVSVTPKPGQLERGVKAVWREYNRILQQGFTATELERAKQNYLNRIDVVMKEKSKTRSSSYVNEYVEHFLKGTASPGIDVEYALTKKCLPQITVAHISALFKEYAKPVNRDLLITANEKDKSGLPDEATALRWLHEVEQEKVVAYQDEVSAQPLLATEPVPGKVIEEKKDEGMNLTYWTFSNGLKVVMKPTPFSNNSISFTAFAPGGTSLYSEAEYQSATNAARAVTTGGAGNLNLSQLRKFLTGKSANAWPSMAERTQNFTGSSDKQHFETALQLMYAYCTAPRKDTGLVRAQLEKFKTDLISRPNDPASAFYDTIVAIMNNYNVRRTGPSPEKVDQVNIERAYEIYKERFADAGAFTFIIVGNFTPDSIRPLLEKYLGSLPATHSNTQAVDLNIKAPKGPLSKTVYGGKDAKASVNLTFTGDYAINQTNNLQMAALKEALLLRMVERLREDEGGVYTPGVQFSARLHPDIFIMTISFSCAPENVEKLIASALDEVEKIKNAGPAQVNIDKFKAEDRIQLDKELKSNEYWLDYINRRLQQGTDMHQIDHYDEVIKTVTPASVQAIARQYLVNSNYLRFVMLPEAMKK